MTTGVLFVLAIFLFAMVSLPVLLDAERDGGSFRVVAGVLFSLFFIAVGMLTVRAVCQIRIAWDGTITLVRGVGATHIPAREIRQIEGLFARDCDGKDVWTMRLRSSRGNFRFGQFHDATAFADQVRKFHPGVAVTGLWPQGSPESLHPRSHAHDRSGR